MPALIIATTNSAYSTEIKGEIRRVDISRADRRRAELIRSAVGGEFIDYSWVIDPTGREFLVYHTLQTRVEDETQPVNLLASLIVGYKIRGNALVFPPDACG